MRCSRFPECVYRKYSTFGGRRQPCRRGTSVPAFPPPDSPLFRLPLANKPDWLFPADYSACVQPITSASLAAYCSASSARAEFLQRVRRLLTGGSPRSACALGGNRLADSFQATSFCSSKKNPPSGGIKHYLTPVRHQPDERRKLQQLKARYRTAGRVLSRRRRGRGLTPSTEPTSADKARSCKARTRRSFYFPGRR